MSKVDLPYVIRMTPETSQQLLASIKGWASPYLCESVVQHDTFSDEKCLQTKVIQSELLRILQDNKIDRIESPKLWRIAGELAQQGGEKGVLDLKEALQVTLAMTLSPVNLQHAAPPMEDPDRPKNNDIRVQSDSPLLNPIQSLIGFFLPNDDEMDSIDHHITSTREYIDHDISFFENYVKNLEERETHYLNFVSAENVWGLSAQLTRDGTPFSAVEVEAARRALSKLREIKQSFDFFIEGWEAGYLREDHPAAQIFFQSPYGPFSHIMAHLQGRASTHQSESAARQIFVGVCRLLEQCGAEGLAALYYTTGVDAFSEPIHPKEVFSQGFLTSPSGVKYLARYKDFANSIASLDMPLSLASGSVVGKLLALSPRVVSFLGKVGTRMGRARALIPGSSFFHAVGNGGSTLMSTVSNRAAELGKVFLYQWSASQVAGPEAGRIAGLLICFGIGTQASFIQQSSQQMVKGVLNTDLEAIVQGHTSELAAKLIERTSQMSADEIMELARRVSHYGKTRSFRLEKGIEPEALANRLMSFRSQLARATNFNQKIVQHTERIERDITELGSLIAGNPTKLGHELLEEAQNIFASVEKNLPVDATALARLQMRERGLSDANNRISGLLSGVKGELRRQPKGRSAATTTNPDPGRLRDFRTITTQKPPKGPSRWRQVPAKPASAKPASAKPAERLKTAPPPLTEVQRILENIPSQLTNETIEVLSHQRVILKSNGGAPVHDWYAAALPGHRKRFLELVKDLGESGFTSRWTRVKTLSDGTRRARVGDYRVLARQKDGRYEITKIEHRREVYVAK